MPFCIPSKYSIFFLWCCVPTWAMTSVLRFPDHTQRRTTVGRTSLGEWSARHTDLYLTYHNTQQINVHTPGGIRTQNLSRRVATDPRLRRRGHCDRLVMLLMWISIFFLNKGTVVVWTARHYAVRQNYCWCLCSKKCSRIESIARFTLMFLRVVECLFVIDLSNDWNSCLFGKWKMAISRIVCWRVDVWLFLRNFNCF